MDVTLNKCIFDFVCLKDNPRRSAYLILLWDIAGSLSQRLLDLIVGVSKIYFCGIPRLLILLLPIAPGGGLVVCRLLLGDDNDCSFSSSMASVRRRS